MAFSAWEMFTPCDWEKSQTCANKFMGCESCNQTHENKGLRVLNEEKIKDNYKEDPNRAKIFKISQQRKFIQGRHSSKSPW